MKKLHPLFEEYFLSGTLTPVQEVKLPFDEWMQQKVYRVLPLRVTKLTPYMLDLYVMLRDLGWAFDRVTGSFSPPGSKVVYSPLSDDINAIVFSLSFTPTRYIPYLFSGSTDGLS